VTRGAYAAEDADVRYACTRSWGQARNHSALRGFMEAGAAWSRCCSAWSIADAGPIATAARPKARDCGKAAGTPGRGAQGSRTEFNIESPKQLQQNSVREAAAACHAQDPHRAPSTAESTGRARGDLSVPRIVLDYRALAKLNPRIPTRCPRRSTSGPGAFIPRTTRLLPRPGGCLPPILTCRTFRSAVQRPPHPAGLRGAPGSCVDGGGLLADRVRINGAFVRR